MLCIDIAEAFNNVLYKRLLDNLRKKGILDFILHWITSFLEERITRIKVIKGESELFLIDTGILQGSSILLILFLFFISELLDTTNNKGLRTSSIGFVDDVHILMYRDLTERNCAVLSRIHR
jgi:Reverse transcriptase (RNA-dependent DNA polymerase)